MKPKNPLIDIGILTCSSVVVACLAAVVTFYALGYPMPPWDRHLLPAAPGEITHILHVEFRPHGPGPHDIPEPSHADPVGDTIFISTTDRTVYSYTPFDNEWKRVASPGAWEETPATRCAPAWDSPEPDARILEPIPLEKAVRASSGIRVGHTMVDAVRCYVLYEDGSLEVWGRELTGDGALALSYYTPCIIVVGLVIGFLAGLLILSIRNKRRAPARHPLAGTDPLGEEAS